MGNRTVLFSHFTFQWLSFISVGLSKFMNEVEASAAYGENNVYGENNGSSGWVTIGTAGILPASHWNLRVFYTHFHVKK